MDMMNKRKMNKKSFVAKGQQEWNDAVSDLDRMKLSQDEQKMKSMSRQSHNQAIARAEMMGQNKMGNGGTRPFSPSKASRLRSNASKTMEEALADSSNVIAITQKLRSENMTNNLSRVEDFLSNEKQPNELGEDAKSGDEMNAAMAGEEYAAQRQLADDARNFGEEEDGEVEDEMRIVARRNDDEFSVYPLSPLGWQNLNNTIQLVVKTCEALWQQLEEERLNRERLHFQLQEQRSVITTLTAELLQVQEHQEIILKELKATRSAAFQFQSPNTFPQHQQEPDHSHMGLQGVSPLPPTDFEGNRLPPRPYAFSDSSIQSKSPNSKPTEKDDLSDHSEMTANPMLQMNEQGLSRSFSQLNTKDNYRDAIRDRIQFNNSRMRLLREAAVRDREQFRSRQLVNG